MTDLAAIGQEAIQVDKAEPDDLQLWSVTTIIGVLDKPALIYWAAGLTADAAIENQATWQGMLEDRGRDEAWKWLRDARFRSPKTRLSATELGTLVHKLCETYALTGTKPDSDFITNEVRMRGGRDLDIETEAAVAGRMLNQFDDWLQRFTPSYQATEVCVYSPEFGYAGQADGFMTIDGVRFIFDYKTSRESFDGRGYPRKPYPSQVGLQLAFYRHAEFAAVWRPRRFEKMSSRYYLLSAEEQALSVPVPEVDTGLVIQITPEHCEAYPIRCDEDVHRSALYTLECFRWVKETSNKVMPKKPLCR